MIFGESNAFEQFVESGGIKIFKENVVVFPKVKRTQNQVFITQGLEKYDTCDLTSIVKTDNDASCENHFWYLPIDNSDEAIGICTKTYWRVKSRYMSEPLNAISREKVLLINSITKM